MSVMELSKDIHVWDNASFDSGGLERSVEMKENQNPLMGTSPPARGKIPFSDTMLQDGETAVGCGEMGSEKRKKDSILGDEAIIDLEIEFIEMEMRRLAMKLEMLRLEKAEKKMKIGDRRGSIVPAKFMELQQSTNPKLGFLQKKQDSRPGRRGASLCPAEIYSATRSRQSLSMSKPEIISSGVKQGRRQSCFWKLGEIDELKVTKERGGKSASVSPKSRKVAPKLDAKKAVTTMGSKKPMKKDVAVLSSVQPKKLFRDGERSAAAPPKKPIQSGRVVASRYNQNSRVDCAKNLPSFQEIRLGDGRVKKRWEIPAKGEVVLYKSGTESTPVIDEVCR